MNIHWLRLSTFLIAAGFATSAMAFQAKVGLPSPKFSALSMDGKRLFLGDLQSEGPIFLYFMRDGDPTTRLETTYIERIVRSYVPSRANWYAVVDGKADRMRSVAAEYNLPFRMLRDEDLSVVHAFGIQNSPAVVEISSDGKVMNIWKGYSGYRLKAINKATAAINHRKLQYIDFSQTSSTTIYGVDYQIPPLHS